MLGVLMCIYRACVVFILSNIIYTQTITSNNIINGADIKRVNCGDGIIILYMLCLEPIHICTIKLSASM